ncbi:MAG: zinc-ribbon domain containing protein [Planctomycetales bacterium]|nr:zinc-ribbon domain containing protein [Planctomycetales bacterium]
MSDKRKKRKFDAKREQRRLKRLEEDGQVWSAQQQKWYYEVAKGSLYATAIRCRECRQKRSAT